MTGTDDLTAWLRAQLDDDERVAQSAIDRIGDEVFDTWRYEPGPEVRYGGRIRIAAGFTVVHQEDGTPDAKQAEHIAHWDPARVLAEVDAKRRILELHAPEPSHYVDGRWNFDEPGAIQCSHCAGLCHSSSGLACDTPDAPWPCPTVRLSTLPYADRPGYRDEWRP